MVGAIARGVALAALAVGLSGCAVMHGVRLGAGEAPTLVGPAVRDNRTPMDAALSCFGGQIASGRGRPLVIGVGDVRDYTGKYSLNEGNAITQGGALMVSSALGKLGGAVGLAERFDPTIGERELAYTDRRQLGDGLVHSVVGQAGSAQVPWLPYYGGSIAASDYYIVGGITELNYDIRSGGVDTELNQVGPKVRTYTQSVAIDLRIVDTRTLLVAKTISLTKQFTGYEVGFNLFRFFGSNLFDINVGAKGQEPLQLGIRTALEEATMRLVGAVSRADPGPCLLRRSWSAAGAAPTLVTAPAVAVAASGSAGKGVEVPINAVPGRAVSSAGAVVDLPYEFGSATLSGGTLALLDRVVAASGKGSVEVRIVAPDTESLDPGKRDALTDQRLAALIAALVARGIAPGAFATVWRANPADTSVHRDGPGLQDIARLRIGG
ncbi:MAG: CsgG/HfaB family protein [Sphingomonas sp.]